MRIDILTLFPEVTAQVAHGVIGRAVDAGALEIVSHQIRDYTTDKHGKCDDTPFGGGEGMVMTPQPLCDAIAAVDPDHAARRIYLTPKGRLLDTATAVELAKAPRLLLLCGHYEGIDQRVIDSEIDLEISIGDYILTGGELPAMVLCDCVARQIPGVLGNPDSAGNESFAGHLLEYPQYTRPQNFRGREVPAVLLSGHHENIDRWRTARAEELTAARRPDLYAIYRQHQEAAAKEKPARKKRTVHSGVPETDGEDPQV